MGAGMRGRRADVESDGPSRRQFLWVLGTGSLAATAVIAGYVSGDERAAAVEAGTATRPDDGRPTPERPALRDGVTFGRRDGLLTIGYVSAPGGSGPVLCAVNEVGAAITRRLDGKHSVPLLASAAAAAAGIEPSDTVEARVACFVAELARLGFLREPFYVQIVERTA